MKGVTSSVPLIVILGPTASGKTAAAIELAERVGGEIICADSRTVYRGMDIGTAKPTADEQRRVPHHLIDIVDPDEPFSAADFKRLAGQTIIDISARGKVPIMVGGTGLYIDSVLFDFEFAGAADPTLRKKLEAMTLDQLQTEVLVRDVPIPRNENNPRHLMRAIERGGMEPVRKPLRGHTLVLGLRVPLEVIETRIAARVDAMVRAGFVDEARNLFAKYPVHTEALRAPGYKAFHDYIDGRISLEAAKILFVKNDRALAKRQMTWFRRNDSIQWIDDPRDTVDIATTFLNKTP